MKTALVSGGARGIGREISKALASDGVRVLINYNKSEEQAKSLAKELGGAALKADISNETEVMKLADRVRNEFGGVDILVNNAGIAMQKMLCDTTPDDWDRIFNTNMRGAYILTRELMGGMVQKKYGKILNISSIWGEVGASCEVAYSASKAALIGFTKALAKELALSGICVNCIAPGVIDTEMNAIVESEIMAEIAGEIPLGRIGSAAEIANCAAFLCSDKAKYITGQVLSVNGGMNM